MYFEISDRNAEVLLFVTSMRKISIKDRIDPFGRNKLVAVNHKQKKLLRLSESDLPNQCQPGMAIAFLKIMSSNMQQIRRRRNEDNRANAPVRGLSLNAGSCSQTQHRYAWLEYEDGLWHFLTGLFADPSESTRRWCDRQHALDVLAHEGWTVIRAYPEQHSIDRNSDNCLHGYGLMRILH
jgi:hypothetical protein